MLKHKCAISCISRDLAKIGYGLDNDDKEICSLLKYKPDDHVSLNLD